MRRFRWLGVAVAIGLSATSTACTSHHNGPPQPATAASSRSPASTPTILRVRASKSFSFVAGVGQAAASDTASLVVAKRINGSSGDVLREVTLLIPRPALSAACVQRADLRLGRVSVTGAPAEMGVFPSAALAFARGQAPEVPSQLLDNQPSGHVTVSLRQPQVSIDVTDLVRAWLRGIFPSRDATVPRTEPLLLTVQPPDLTNGRYAVTFAGIGTREGPMLLIQDRC